MRAPLRAAAAALIVASAAGANELDDIRWRSTLDAIAEGRLADPYGGVHWLRAGDRPAGFWAVPFERVELAGTAAHEYDRDISTPARPRQIAASLALSCEFQEGRPCGDGVGGFDELDFAAGYGQSLTAFARFRGAAGTGPGYGSAFEVDRAFLRFEAGPFAIQAGRDVLALGPSVRSALMVSTNAAPQDGIRAQLLPVTIVPGVRLSLFYFLDRLRGPQRFSGTLLDCARAQLDLFGRIQLGGSRLLELGGDGAPDFGGLSGFILEHFGRTREGIAAGSAENNRLSFDLSIALPELRGARFYYEIAFEDTRQRFFNSLRYDADHLLGLEVRALRAGPLRRVFVELLHTGWVSQEHWLFTAGLTNRGRTLGSPLGPDATSFWARADFEAGPLLIAPWLEWIRMRSDTYDSNEQDGVFVTAVGPIEHRQRLGVDLEAELSPRLRATASLFGERVANAAFVDGDTRLSGGIRLAVMVRR